MSEKEKQDTLANPLTLFDVDQDVVLITGASGSFGHGCAKALGAMGARLMLVSGSEEELEETAADVKSTGAEVQTLVRRPDSLADAEDMLAATLDAYGRIDKLVVASGYNKAGFIQDLAYED